MEKPTAEYFDRLWQDSVPHDGMKHTKETWDKIAETWNNDPPEVIEKKQKMAVEITELLKARGALRPGFDVIDIGCGPGKYVVEFAKTANTVTASDVSSKMLEYVMQSAEKRGLTNVIPWETDFLNYNPDGENPPKKYDLVFTSLTPAMSGLESVRKVNKLSRGYCFNISFVYKKDNLRNAMLSDIFGKEPNSNWGNSSPYCLFNILWQLGFHPEMTYYKEILEFDVPLTKALADECARMVIRDKDPDAETVDRIYKYLEDRAVDGMIQKRTESLFALTLWKTEED